MKVTPRNEWLKGLSTNGLLMLYGAVKEALKQDDARPVGQKKYEIRETKDWKIWADDLEEALNEKGVSYDKINWESPR